MCVEKSEVLALAFYDTENRILNKNISDFMSPKIPEIEKKGES